ncbi:MAG: hypothetical protein OJF49_000611 [Ktedonobacterales bacterium]|jgi:hypothetical protein|nr:MAG: hypothetical protein OJF49_000611 [Ktedonobacterales bacterium]
MAIGAFATAINCIDGRAQAPVADWIKIHCNVTFVDTVTVPGPDRFLVRGPEDRLAHILEYVKVSLTAHNSHVIAIAGHHGCAANPVSREEHLTDIREAARKIVSWGLSVRVIGLWVNEWWQVELVSDSA